MFYIGNHYTKYNIYSILNVPKNKRRGAWDTGYREYEGNYYIFANLGVPGRTGHDYRNYWDGDVLYWQGKTRSNIHQPLIQGILEASINGKNIYIFTRTENRAPFIFEGKGRIIEFSDTSPVEVLWKCENDDAGYKPSEKLPQELFANEMKEGSGKTVIVNKYERNPHARRLCVNYFGTKCQVCEFDFEEIYGDIGKQFIHVHHRKSLAEIGKEYIIDPIKDLIPVCPNCHSMIHKREPCFTISEIREKVNNYKKN